MLSLSLRSAVDILHVKRTAVTVQPWAGPEDSKRLRSPIFQDMSAHEGGRVVSLTHQPPLPPPPPGNIPGIHFCLRLSPLQGHSAAGRIMSMRNSSATIFYM